MPAKAELVTSNTSVTIISFLDIVHLLSGRAAERLPRDSVYISYAMIRGVAQEQIAPKTRVVKEVTLRRTRLLSSFVAVLMIIWGSSALAAGFSIFEQGAKATGMGGAFAATADDPSAMFSRTSSAARATSSPAQMPQDDTKSTPSPLSTATSCSPLVKT